MGIDPLSGSSTGERYRTLEGKRVGGSLAAHISHLTNEVKNTLCCGGVERLTVASDCQLNINSVIYRK